MAGDGPHDEVGSSRALLSPTVKAMEAQAVQDRTGQLVKLLEGRKRLLVWTHTHPDPDALQSLIMQGGATQKFFDDTQPQFHPKDVELALQINKYPFAMKINREDGLLVARKVMAGYVGARIRRTAT